MMSNGGVGVAQYQSVLTADSHDEQIVTQRLVWNSRTVPLSDALRGRATPVVVRDDVARRDLYVHSVSPTSAVLADGLTAEPRCGLVFTGRRYLIPADHRGWFELLSQDGHAAAPITTVQQLMSAAPDRCLVRRTIVALSDDDLGRSACKISSGQTLSIEGVVSRGQYLRCRVDSTRQRVLLASDQRGLFSPIAGPTNVAGVHRMRSLVVKFRLPVVVRLINRNNSTSQSASSDNSGSTSSSVAFRVTAIQTEPAAYVVPLWLINCPSDANRRSLLSLPTSAQASSVLDGISTTVEARASASEIWTDCEWAELRRRCDQLIKAGDVAVELTRVFPTHNVDDRQRAVPVTSSLPLSHRPQSSVDDDEWRLLREIDHIYEAIKTHDIRGRANGLRATTTRQIPRRYRNVRQDGKDTAAFNGGAVRTRSPARRSHSHTLDKLPHHHDTLDPLNHVQSHHQLHKCRQTSPSPVRLRRVMSNVMPAAAMKRRMSSPPLQQLQSLAQHSEPVYEELTTPGDVTSGPTEPVDVVDSGPCVALADSAVSPADNLRQVIKHKSTTSSTQPHRSTSVDRPRRWSVAVATDHNIIASQLQVFGDRTSTINDDTPRPDSASAGVHADTVSSGPPTTSSSDDVTATDRKSSSRLAAVSSTVKRALCRNMTGTKTRAENVYTQAQGRYSAAYQPTNDRTSRHADDAAVTSQPSCDVIALEYAGGKVTHF